MKQRGIDGIEASRFVLGDQRRGSEVWVSHGLRPPRTRRPGLHIRIRQPPVGGEASYRHVSLFTLQAKHSTQHLPEGKWTGRTAGAVRSRSCGWESAGQKAVRRYFGYHFGDPGCATVGCTLVTYMQPHQGAKCSQVNVFPGALGREW